MVVENGDEEKAVFERNLEDLNLKGFVTNWLWNEMEGPLCLDKLGGGGFLFEVRDHVRGIKVCQGQ